MPKLDRARSPGRNANLYADVEARAAEIVGKGLFAEITGDIADMWNASRATLGALWDTAASPIGDAITDIRKKFEEFAWGREVTPREFDISREPPSVEARMGFRELMDAQAAMLPSSNDRVAQARREQDFSGPEM